VRHGAAGAPVWLPVRRSLEPVPEVKYYVSNADASTPLGVLAEVACTRHAVEDYFEDAKSYLGMAQYETRSWVGWHHHMTLVGLAHLFVTLARLRLKKKLGWQSSLAKCVLKLLEVGVRVAAESPSLRPDRLSPLQPGT
jgi:hypothetical protein